jgi:hypothetical protein
MKIYYQEEQWFHQSKSDITWGKGNSTLPLLPSPTSFYVEIKTQNLSIKPLVGILAGDSSTKPFAGNEIAFQRIQLALQQTGGLSFVFTPDGLNNESTVGYIYDFSEQLWRRAVFPHPDVVYNRIPFRKLEGKTSFQNSKEQLQALSIPYFNECFFHKWETFQKFSENPMLLPYLPKTFKLADINSFKQMTDQFKQVYLKPCSGKKGKGIMLVERNDDSTWNVETITRRTKSVSYIELLDEWLRPLLQKEYIIQQGISPLKWNGARFDYRVFVHRKNHKDFTISGIGVRQSQGQQVTTHVPAGGRIVSFSDLPFPEDESTLCDIGSLVGRTLLDHYQNVGEFSMDIGKNVNGELFLFEVNSKPMVFDEDVIRKQGLQHLLQLFSFLAEK